MGNVIAPDVKRVGKDGVIVVSWELHVYVSDDVQRINRVGGGGEQARREGGGRED